ncbi:MAG: LuxR C-terminal-related transcriptional regulator [Azonexus sp.]|nr:LuxR C-terminal-related transcriptional regulator [Azonexus sp.]
MDTLVTLSTTELERLLVTIESSQQVHRRNQYFLWTQGVLQSFLPHDVLIFGHGEFGAPDFRCEVLARANTWEDHALHSELDRLVARMVESWQRSGHVPRLFQAGGEVDCVIGQALGRLGLGHALAHGTKEFIGESSGFFVFLRMPEAPGRRHAYFAEVLMPYLHTTLHRMLVAEKDSPDRRLRTGHKLSAREAEVISLVRDGNTNQQIAKVLELSPLTVKNHVQNILRKLEVANRAQAVAKAVKARLIGDSPGA